MKTLLNLFAASLSRRAVFIPTEQLLLPLRVKIQDFRKVVRDTGFEPVTSCV